MSRVATPQGSVTYEHDSSGRVTRIESSTGYEARYGYTETGRLAFAGSNKLSTDGKLAYVQYAFDGETGRRTDITRPNDATTHYDYSALGAVATITHRNGGFRGQVI